MTPPPWHVTHSAAKSYAVLMRWHVEGEESWAVIERAARELTELMGATKFKARDRHGREIWRSQRSVGRALRWIVDPRVPPPCLPELIWVGRGTPPLQLWSPDES